jgi:glycosyltransferase involved in cell wall biosynthesis
MLPDFKVSGKDGLAADAQEVAGLVSVIIPTYNSAEYLEQSLQSVFSQTYSFVQVIVVDDGSTDDTRQVLAPYIREGKIQYCFQQNRGPAAARNLGIQQARGEFIGFLDADDLWLPEKLESQVVVLRKNPDIGMVYSDSEWFGEEWDRQCAASRKLRENDRRKAEYFCRGDIYKTLLAHNFIPTMAVLVRHSVLKKTGPFLEQINGRRFSYGEDFELWLRVARACKVEFSLQKSVKRRVHPGQLTSNKRYGYSQLCALYGYLWSQRDCTGKGLIARKYLENSLKRIVAGILRM